MTKPVEVTQAAENTDRELWREREGDYYANSLHVTAQGGIGVNVGGHVIVKPLTDWHALADTRDQLTAATRTQDGMADELERWADIADDNAAIAACGDRWGAVAKIIGCQLYGFNDGHSASFTTPDGNVIEIGPQFRQTIVSLRTPTQPAVDKLVEALTLARRRMGEVGLSHPGDLFDGDPAIEQIDAALSQYAGEGA